MRSKCIDWYGPQASVVEDVDGNLNGWKKTHIDTHRLKGP